MYLRPITLKIGGVASSGVAVVKVAQAPGGVTLVPPIKVLPFFGPETVE
jgi:hypothetical protein